MYNSITHVYNIIVTSVPVDAWFTIDDIHAHVPKLERNTVATALRQLKREGFLINERVRLEGAPGPRGNVVQYRRRFIKEGGNDATPDTRMDE